MILADHTASWSARARGCTHASFIACGMLLSPAAARADLQIAWDAPAGCPSESEVAQTVRELSGASAIERQSADVEIEADVSESESGYVMELRMRTASGTRSMRLSSLGCALLARVVGLQTALLLSNESPAERRRTAGSDTGPSVGLRAHAGLATTPLPFPSFVAGIAGSLRLSPLRLEWTLRYVFARELHYEEQPEVGGTLRAWSTSLSPCVGAVWAGCEWSACVALEAGIVRGEGIGLQPSRVTDRLSFAVSAGAALRIPVSTLWSVWIGAAAPWVLTRPAFFVPQLGTLHRPDRIGLRAEAGIELRLP
jgi:hypothetical protein